MEENKLMKHTKKILILLVIVFLLVGLGTLAATNNTQNNANIKKNTETTHTQTIQDVTKTPITQTQNKTLEKQVQKTIKDENKKQDTEPINIANYNDLARELTDSTTPTKILTITEDIKLESSPSLSTSITMLTINGNHKTINGDNQYQFLTINSGQTVIINNLTITNCKAAEGGAIHNIGGTVTITNSNLTENNGTWGGAIHNYQYATMTINNSTLTYNNATYGGAIYNWYSTMTLTDNTINNNTAAFIGGAINNHDNARMTLTGNTINNNTAIKYYGGAIYNHGGSMSVSTMTLINNTLNNNNAKGEYGCGGAIYNHENANITITGNTINNNTATINGGAIYNNKNSNMTLTGNTINNNNASTEGAIYNNASIKKIENNKFGYNTPANFKIEDNKIKLISDDNFISVGDFIIIDDEEVLHGSGTSDFENCIIPSTSENVKLILNGTDTTTENNVFTLREPKEINVTGYPALVAAIEDAINNDYGQYTINLLAGDYNATTSIDWSNSVTRKIIINGNGYTLDGNNTYQFIQIAEDHDLTLENITITKYATTMSGGAINNNGNLTVRNSNLTYNLAGNGGAIHNTGEYTISDTLFYNNNPVNFQINENNNIELINTDGFISINDFTIITDYGVYHGNGQEALEQYTISPDTPNIKLLLNGTNTTDNTFIIKGNNEKINSQKTKITNENPFSGSTTDITATFIIEDNPITDGRVIFRLNGKTLRDDDGKVIYVNINEGAATLEDVPITNAWAGSETTLQAIFVGNGEFEPLYTDKLIISVSKREAQMELTAPGTAQAGETITLSASLTAGGEPVTTGRVAFKLNGKTLKDKDGKALHVNVVNGFATTTYTLPAKIKANTYTLKAVFADNTYERAEKTKELLVRG